MSIKSYRKTMMDLALKSSKRKKLNNSVVTNNIDDDFHACNLPKSKNGGSFKCYTCGQRWTLAYAPNSNYRWARR